jgi:uncharacterized protein
MPAPSDPLLPQLAVIATAAIAGAVNSIAGGGTFLTFPALTGLAKLTEKAANMTSTVGLWPGSAASVVAARSEFRTIPRSMLLTFGLMSFLGGTAGSLLLIFTSNHTFRLVIPWLLLFATIVFAFSKPIARWAGRKHGDRSLKWTLFVAAIQLFVAIYGGYFGAGIGVLMLAGLSFAGLDSIHQMNALKVLLATIINGIAVIIFLTASLLTASPADRIHWPLALGMVLASIAGGFTGMHFARKIKPDNLRLIILSIGSLLTAAYFYNVYFHP